MDGYVQLPAWRQNQSEKKQSVKMASPTETDQHTPHEQRVARRVIEATIRDAHHAADLVTAVLRDTGYQPAKRRSDSDEETAEGPAMQKAKAMLLNLGATLRIAEWERAGVKSRLPHTLPGSSEALRAIMPNDQKQVGPPRLTAKVLETLLKSFALSGRAKLGADVLLECEGLEEDALLDVLADFLWRHRHLAKNMENN